jgi:hypothetical protein
MPRLLKMEKLRILVHRSRLLKTGRLHHWLSENTHVTVRDSRRETWMKVGALGLGRSLVLMKSLQIVANPRAATPTALVPARAGLPIAASLPATTQTSRAPTPLAESTAIIDYLVAANPPAGVARTSPSPTVIIMVQVGRLIGARLARATRANGLVVTITAGIGRLIAATRRVGMNLQETVAVSLTRAMVVLSMRTNPPVLGTNPPIAAGLFLRMTWHRLPGQLSGTIPGTSPIREAKPRVVTIIVLVGTTIVRVGRSGTHRVMVTIPVRRMMANSRVVKMQQQVGVNLVLTGSCRVAIIAVRGGSLTLVDLPAMAITIVIQIEATTT